eukprot:3776850-Rhodomonas_salina.1
MLPFPETPKTVAISAPCGSGKTKQIIQYVKTHDDHCHVIVMHRKTLSRQVYTDLEHANVNVQLYSATKGPLLPEAGK